MESRELPFALGGRSRPEVVVSGAEVNVGHVQEPWHVVRVSLL